MKRLVSILFLLVGIIGSASAQRDDLYFVPKKKDKTENIVKEQAPVQDESAQVEHSAVVDGDLQGLGIDEDTYNRRGSYITEQGDAVSEFAMSDEGFVLITEEGDTMWMNTDTLRLTRVGDDEGWVNGFDGSDSDYEYAMRIVRFRNPRYAIPVSSPLYWDVVYGGALWPSWEWNVYDDGMYAYVFPTSSNWLYWDYRMSYPFGWSAWGAHHYGYHWGYYAGYHYGHVWYDPWYNPYFYDYYPGWHHGHHHGHYPHFGAGGPGWGGGGPKAFPNHRTPVYASSRRGAADSAAGRGEAHSASSSRTGVSGRVSTDGTRRIDNGSGRNSSVRVVTGNTGVVRSSSGSRTGGDEVLRRSTGSSSANRTTATGHASRSSYTPQSSSRSSSSSSSYSRSGSSSSYSRSGSSSSSSSVSRSSSSGSSSRSSYSGGSSRSSYSSSSSSYSSGSSYSGGSRSGGSYSGGSSSRSSSGSRR